MFTAKIISITPSPDGSGAGINWLVDVTFNDSASGYSQDKTYSFPMGTTQASAVQTITADGTALKTALASASTLANKVGSVITI